MSLLSNACPNPMSPNRVPESRASMPPDILKKAGLNDLPREVLSVSDSLARKKVTQLYSQNFGLVIHTKLTQLYTHAHNIGGWGRAREEKDRIDQPGPWLNFIIETQPPLHFLRLTITLQHWGKGRGPKKRVGSTSHAPCLYS